jgi:hypothetical protein
LSLDPTAPSELTLRHIVGEKCDSLVTAQHSSTRKHQFWSTS